MKQHVVFLLLMLFVFLSLLGKRSLLLVKVGSVDFPVSCASSQQAAFNRGVALLHDFWYDRAEEQFKDIAAADRSVPWRLGAKR